MYERYTQVGLNKIKGGLINSQETWKKLMSILINIKDNINITIE